MIWQLLSTVTVCFAAFQGPPRWGAASKSQRLRRASSLGTETTTLPTRWQEGRAVRSSTDEAQPSEPLGDKAGYPEVKARRGSDALRPNEPMIHHGRRQALERVLLSTLAAGGSAAVLAGAVAPVEEAAASGGATAGRYTYVDRIESSTRTNPTQASVRWNGPTPLQEHR